MNITLCHVHWRKSRRKKSIRASHQYMMKMKSNQTLNINLNITMWSEYLWKRVQDDKIYFCNNDTRHPRAECKPFGAIGQYFTTVRFKSKWICCTFFSSCTQNRKIKKNKITVIREMFCTWGEDRIS